MYQVVISNKAKKRLSKLPAKHKRQLLEQSAALQANPRPPNCEKLKVLDGYRISCGEYHVLYTVSEEQKTVEVYLVFQRGEGYPDP
ncbi:MAG: type II toxin-antitoxin system RelE family toxin [Anaerolineae bacterium]